MMIIIPSRTEQKREQLQQKYYMGRRVRKNQVKRFGIETFIYALNLNLMSSTKAVNIIS